MYNVIVSAHGGRWSNQQKDLELKKGKIVYFVNDGVILPNKTGYKILNHLKQSNEPGGTVVESVNPNEKTYDYSCWFAEEFKETCGIFEVKTGRLLKDLKNYSENNPLLLSDILKEFPGLIIYWVCCREVSN
ncbi:MAG: hypothetical protein HOO91_16815 [Bacteroidales bacterium]|nr:hypothetical protein [Bacteroidales bacterium]